MPRQAAFKEALCTHIGDLSLHAAVRCAADDSKALEQLGRHITRPAPPNDHVQTNAGGQAVLKLRGPWRDGIAYLVT